MAGEIQCPLSATGWTVYAVLRDSTGQAYRQDTAVFEAYSSANLTATKYCITLTEQGTASRFYAGTMPTVAAGTYSVSIYRQAGGSPAEGDTLVGAGVIEWDGTAVVPLSSRLAAASYTAPPAVSAIADAVWDEAIAGHLTAGTTGHALNQAGSAADPLENQVPGSYASGTAGHALGRISSAQVTTVSPVAEGGLVTVEAGRDYYAADGLALDWTDSEDTWPTLTGASVTLTVYAASASPTTTVLFSASGTVVTATGTGKKVRVELPAATTSGLAANSYAYLVSAALSGGHIVALARGTITIHAGNL